MAEVASDNDVPFVDLFAASQKLYAARRSRLTINGVHLTAKATGSSRGHRPGLFGARPGRIRREESSDDCARRSLDKNFHWFDRYRTPTATRRTAIARS